MELEGVLKEQLEKSRDAKRFKEVLAFRPHEIAIAETAMLDALRKLAANTEPLDNEDCVFVGSPPHHSMLNRATPWLCETEDDELGASASVRVAVEHRANSQRVWKGAIQTRVSDIDVDDEANKPSVDTLATFTVYEPRTEDDDVTFVTYIEAGSDMGHPGSASWAQVQAMLDEAVAEVEIRAATPQSV